MNFYRNGKLKLFILSKYLLKLSSIKYFKFESKHGNLITKILKITKKLKPHNHQVQFANCQRNVLHHLAQHVNREISKK